MGSMGPDRCHLGAIRRSLGAAAARAVLEIYELAPAAACSPSKHHVAHAEHGGGRPGDGTGEADQHDEGGPGLLALLQFRRVQLEVCKRPAHRHTSRLHTTGNSKNRTLQTSSQFTAQGASGDKSRASFMGTELHKGHKAKSSSVAQQQQAFSLAPGVHGARQMGGVARPRSARENDRDAGGHERANEAHQHGQVGHEARDEHDADRDGRVAQQPARRRCGSRVSRWIGRLAACQAGPGTLCVKAAAPGGLQDVGLPMRDHEPAGALASRSVATLFSAATGLRPHLKG